MPELLHLTERSLWEAARAKGAYEGSTRGRTLQDVGFVHCSSRAQLPRVAAFVYGDYSGPDELVVLVIDAARLAVPVRHEPPEPGADETFPHIYGPVPVDAVVRVEPWSPAPGQDS